MKKLFILVLVALSLTACGSSKGNTVVCSNDEETIELRYNDKETVESMKMSNEQKGVTKEDFEEGKAMMEIIAAEMNKLDGMNFEFSHTGDTVKMSINVDLTKIPADELEKFGFSAQLGTDLNINKVKEKMTSNGFTCK